MYKKLLDKGFRKTVYIEQEGTPVFYSKKISDTDLVIKLLILIEEISKDDDSTFDGITGTIEVTEDLTIAQYSFISNTSADLWEFGQVTEGQFELILEALPDEINRA
ncbi:hypothetical protein POF51_26125 [Brevibacillus sp. AG]|uniref:hypothetical protein n=1 Tax=Brevibacillus sp. AG TaxID=3020891 RepID=UPI00232C0F3D|nr:hypothetical protein [Brevibacillus sp. AG]MDC0764201.1 hypothetical protein [Brevibacillus sp. AG]